MKLVTLAWVGLFLSACATAPLPGAVHWFRDAAEQKAVYEETYRAAASAVRRLSQNLDEGSWGVVLDIDETVLDNSDYQKQVA